MNKTNYWKLGLFVVSGAVLALTALFWISARYANRPTVSVVTYFDESVQGLEVGAPVKVRGVTIGQVKSITLAPDHTHVEVHVDFFLDMLERAGLRNPDSGPGQRGWFVPANVRTQVAMTGITGNRYISIDFMDPEIYPPPELSFPTPRNYIPSASSTLRGVELTLNDLRREMPKLVDGAQRLLDNLNVTLETIDFERLVAATSSLVENLDAKLNDLDAASLNRELIGTLTEARSTLGESRAVVNRLGREGGPLESALTHTGALMKRLESTVDEVDVAGTVASLRHAAESLDRLAEQTSDTVRDVRRDLPILREALDSLRALAQLLDRDPGALLRGRTSEGPIGAEVRR